MRTGFVSTVDLGCLHGYEMLSQRASELRNEEIVNVDGFFYSTAFHAGIDRFILNEEAPAPRSEFIRSRTKFLQRRVHRDHLGTVLKSFGDYVPGESKTIPHDLMGSAIFVANLFEAMDLGVCLVSAVPIPDLSESQDIPPSILEPLRLLVSSFEVVPVPALAPTISVSRESVQRYQEILTSDIYRKYVRAEAGLDDAQASIATVIGSAKSVARRAIRSHPDIFSAQATLSLVLAFTPKIVDTVLGKLPGILADVAASLGSKYLESRRRIVVVDLGKALLDKTLTAFDLPGKGQGTLKR